MVSKLAYPGFQDVLRMQAKFRNHLRIGAIRCDHFGKTHLQRENQAFDGGNDGGLIMAIHDRWNETEGFIILAGDGLGGTVSGLAG